RGALRPRARSRPVHDRRRRRFQHGGDGEQGAEHLQLEVRVRQSAHRHRPGLRRDRVGRRPRVLPQLARQPRAPPRMVPARARAVKRIEDVRVLRAAQFPEDAGPMAHPIRPDSYQEINNFYTVTVYEKGAEVIRMLQTLVGRDGFRRGMDLYFRRHDGQAVTCDDYVAAIADANGIALGQFGRWYSQAGTPRVRATGRHDAAARRYVLELEQRCPPSPGQATKLPFHIPLAIGLVG